MGEIKSIPTFYDGILYRSRLEARWEVFFKHLGFDFDYEPEGVVCDGLCYLVDFWLPKVKMFAEVKPTWLDGKEKNKAKMIAEYSGHPCLILDGPPAPKAYIAIEPYDSNHPELPDEVFYGIDAELYRAEARFWHWVEGYNPIHDREYMAAVNAARVAFTGAA